MANALVVGGSGFLGSHVSDQLSEKGYNVVIFDKEKSQYLRSDQKMVVGDVQNYHELVEATKNIDYVYHFAAIADIKEAQENPIDTVSINVLSTVKLLHACVHNNVKRFIYGSTVYVYSERGSFYRSSKQSSELFIENFKKIYNLDYTILRFGSLYGPRANHFNFINNIIHQALIEGKIKRKGDGNEIREYVHVVDAARASVEILVNDFLNTNVIITGNQTMKVSDLLEMIKEMFNNEITIEYLSEIIEEHYEITPYSFRPKVAKKYVLNYYHDLGQGILDSIYDAYSNLPDEKRNKMKIDLNNSIYQ